MAQKESHHREVVETLNIQLSQVRRQLDDLTTLSRDQVFTLLNPTFGVHFSAFPIGLEHVY